MKALTLQYIVPASAKEIRPYFSDLEKFGALHPYMTEVKKLSDTSCSIREEIRLLGFIPMKPFYTANVTVLENEIYYTSDVRKGVDLKIRFQFSELAPGKQTLITEILEVKANPLVAAVFMNIMKKSHKILIENLEKAVKNKSSL